MLKPFITGINIENIALNIIDARALYVAESAAAFYP
jgi:hypothetical protein